MTLSKSLSPPSASMELISSQQQRTLGACYWAAIAVSFNSEQKKRKKSVDRHPRMNAVWRHSVCHTAFILGWINDLTVEDSPLFLSHLHAATTLRPNQNKAAHIPRCSLAPRPLHSHALRWGRVESPHSPRSRAIFAVMKPSQDFLFNTEEQKKAPYQIPSIPWRS